MQVSVKKKSLHNCLLEQKQTCVVSQRRAFIFLRIGAAFKCALSSVSNCHKQAVGSSLETNLLGAAVSHILQDVRYEIALVITRVTFAHVASCNCTRRAQATSDNSELAWESCVSVSASCSVRDVFYVSQTTRWLLQAFFVPGHLTVRVRLFALHCKLLFKSHHVILLENCQVAGRRGGGGYYHHSHHSDVSDIKTLKCHTSAPGARRCTSKARACSRQRLLTSIL